MDKQKQQKGNTIKQEDQAVKPAEKKSTGKQSHGETIEEKEANNNDYWNRITEDPASGYKNEEGEDPLLNADQQPDDHKRGDQAS